MDGLALVQGNLGLRQNGDLWKGTIIKVESVGFFLMRRKASGNQVKDVSEKVRTSCRLVFRLLR